MKQIYVFFLLSIFAFSCNSNDDKGALDTEILSKKLFEAVKTNNLARIEELMPDKSAFKKLIQLENKGKDISSTQISEMYNKLYKDIEIDLIETAKYFKEGNTANFINASENIIKEDLVTEGEITIKFKAGDGLYKIAYNAKKLGGKWYYYDNLLWMDKDSIIQK